MKRSRFSEEQIVRAIHEHDQGKKAEDICREMGVFGLAGRTGPVITLYDYHYRSVYRDVTGVLQRIVDCFRFVPDLGTADYW